MDRFPVETGSLSDFEQALKQLNCFVSSRTTLATLPGSIHWHIKSASEPRGTLEFTQLPSGESWLSFHQNRHRPWINDVLQQIL